MKRSTLFAACGLSLVLGACGAAPDDDFRDAVPTKAQLGLEVPDAAAEQIAGQKTFALLGQRADLYQLTYDVTHNLNGAVWIGLNIVEEIVKHPPSALQQGLATWGPHTPPLSPLTWMLVVKQEARPGDFSYALTARRKNEGNDTFVPILAGRSRRGVGGFVGVYAADATALHDLDPQAHPAVGKLVTRYDTRVGIRSVRLALAGYSEQGEEPVDLAYRYLVGPKGAGLFRFIAKADLQKNGSAEETIAVATQWKRSGEGRGDALFSGGDIPQGVVVHATECWDDGFARTFYTDSAGVNPPEGDAAACPFTAPAPEQEQQQEELELNEAP